MATLNQKYHLWSQAEKKQLLSMHASGYSRSQIAQEMGLSWSSINNAFTRYITKPENHKKSIYPAQPKNTRSEKIRSCLKCHRGFFSDGPGNRICSTCKNTNNACGSHIPTYKVAL